MSYIETFPVQHSTIIRIYSDKDDIVVDPEYQRNGGVWTPEKKQLLIDSILNNYDIPKIYFHQFSREERQEKQKTYAIIDGKQRIETIWSFVEGKFCLSDDFEYQDNPNLKLAGLSYEDLAKEYPKVRIKFDSFVLPIIGVQTDDLDLIEDMFSRLNEAVPLNSAEKRNAFGGDMVNEVRKISKHSFFIKNVKFPNNRYQHYESAAKLLLVEVASHESGKLIDTKKVYLDHMVKQYKSGSIAIISQFEKTINEHLTTMSDCFTEKDILLKAQGVIVVYYLLFKWAKENDFKIKRSKLLEFSDFVKQNREQAELDYANADYDLLEYDRLSQHGTNDVSNIKERLRILSDYILK
ncbi:DUF262 domain-containing protein [Pedobacter sp. AJM]|uniref:DUF262 domain-containing protein n=1 Tax=Pedobacter sp. AJM TaxID=2003629 RepID=UPI000B4AB253|nr:DUF262 domain-containing protein [Pedobacter sp. AJM]OWK71435.1 hypothetical protein CBW18_10295 [Pedobacter sp. AJM]